MRVKRAEPARVADRGNQPHRGQSAAAASMWAAFVTNAAVGVRSVRFIDDVRYDPDAELIRDLSEAYAGVPGEDL